VLINWAWDYFFYERAARLITRDWTCAWACAWVMTFGARFL